MKSLVDNRNIHTIKRDLLGIAIFLIAIWVVFALDRFLPLEQYGLVPRDTGGLIGIVAMPFLHGDFKHLMGNTVPLAITLFLLAGSRADSGAIVVLITILGGLGLWLFGRSALHIGASGLVFGLIAFHIFAGIFEKRLRSIIIAVVVGGTYWATLFGGIIPGQKGVSWDGHLFGAIAGVLVALVTAKMLKDDPTTSTNQYDRESKY
jgi:membrane associated rhomboid family serine protease